MNIDVKPNLLNWIQRNYYNPLSLLVILLVCSSLFYKIYPDIVLYNRTITTWHFTAISITILIICWIVTTRLPKHKKGKIGITVAICSDTQSEQEQISRDFYGKLIDYFDSSSHAKYYSIKELPSYYSEKIKSKNDALKFLNKTRSHFILHGTARTRNESHLVELRGLVAHKDIRQHIQKAFSIEFTELLPRINKIKYESDIFDFEVKSNIVGFVAEYIIATAALLSYDFKFSMELFEGLQERIRSCPLKDQAIIKIRSRIPNRLTDLYVYHSNVLYRKWNQERTNSCIEEAKPFLDKLNIIAKKNYSANNLRAIYYFVVERNVAAAKYELLKCKGERDATWRYGMAFLYAYEGDLKNARKYYEAAFDRDVKPHVPREVIEFMAWVLDLEPDKYQLLFCMGLINCRMNKDYTRALSDLESFVNRADETLYEDHIKIAYSYIGSIKRKMT
jgi:hypothetical protein